MKSLPVLLIIGTDYKAYCLLLYILLVYIQQMEYNEYGYIRQIYASTNNIKISAPV